ncbi:counting factor associated protein D-like, partial [Saccoglossus kowalevskii]|uniref:Counting factor associated protein D-like n=1 Tax=Saccoglossus kowalevskii TaxID=10224 RepID=A0ABM0H0U6_SACKO
MVKMLCIQVLALLCAIFVVEGVPTFSDVYHTSGILRLPYAELNEPFEVFYNKSAAASRMDFYGGMDKTYLLATKGTYGTSFIISPMTDKSGTSAAECFLVNGTKDGPIAIQSILPDVSQFKSIGKIIVRGIITDGWQLVVTNGNKKNTYTMAVLDNKPVQYEMMGYDSLLGSHYDKYIVDYMHYDTLPIDPKIFVIQDESKCGSFPGPGIEHHLASNPLQELVNPDKENSIHKLFDEFKNKHDKQYHGDDEHEMRKMHFTNNVRYIHSKNRAGLTYKLAVNHLADRSQNELKTMNGYRYSGVPHEGYPFHKLDMPLTDIPDAIDWNIK